MLIIFVLSFKEDILIDTILEYFFCFWLRHADIVCYFLCCRSCIRCCIDNLIQPIIVSHYDKFIDCRNCLVKLCELNCVALVDFNHQNTGLEGSWGSLNVLDFQIIQFDEAWNAWCSKFLAKSGHFSQSNPYNFRELAPHRLYRKHLSILGIFSFECISDLCECIVPFIKLKHLVFKGSIPYFMDLESLCNASSSPHKRIIDSCLCVVASIELHLSNSKL